MPPATLTNNAQERQLQGVPGQPQSQIGAGKVQELYTKGLQAIRTEQHQYWLNHAYLLGEQWLWWNPTTHSLDQLPRDPDRVQMTVNQLWPTSRSIIAKLISRQLVFDVPPSGADDATIQAAMTSESILNSLTTEHDWETLREELAWNVWKGGTAALCVDWDSTLGESLGVAPSGQEVHQGDTVESALSIVDFVVEPGVRVAEKARWWIKAVALPPETVQEMFDLPEAPASDASAALTPFQSKLMSEHAGLGPEGNAALTKVLTYYERPGKKNPEGAMVVVVADKVVDQGPWPFPFKDRLNLTIVRETVIPGRWTGETVLKAGRSIQNAINQSWSSIVEHMKLAGNARLFIPASVVDMIQDLTDLPGEIVPYPDGETPPQWTSPPQMPAWWIEQPDKLSLALDNVLGHHDVSRGEAPVNIESGVGLSILIEQDSTPIGRMVKEMARAFGRMGHQVLSIYQENVLETRQAVVKTPGQPAQTAPWTGGDLLGQIDAQVPVDAVMPRSRAQQLEFAKQALQMGLISTLEQFVRLAEHPDARQILETLSPDVAKARRENAKMCLGVPEPPAKFDNHTAHIQEHLTFMKGPRWDTLSQQSQEIFLLHNQAHAVLDAELLGRRLAMGQVSPILAASADPNGAPALPLEALGAAGPGPNDGGSTPPPANAPVPAAPEDPKDAALGKQIGNSHAANRGAGHQFNDAAGIGKQ